MLGELLGYTGGHWDGYWDIVQGTGTYWDILGSGKIVTGGIGRVTGMYCRALGHTGAHWGGYWDVL